MCLVHAPTHGNSRADIFIIQCMLKKISHTRNNKRKKNNIDAYKNFINGSFIQVRADNFAK